MNTQTASQSSMAQRLLMNNGSIRRWTVLLAALSLTASVTAQELLAPAPAPPLVAPVIRPTSPDAVPAFSSFQNLPTGPGFSKGEFKLHPHLFTSFSRADGLPIQSGARVASDVYTFSPGLLADIGQHWTADYTASAVKYSNDTLNHSLSQDIRVVGANQAPDLGLQLTESYSNTTRILLETARQTKQISWANGLSAEHQFGNVLSYQGSAGMTYTDTENLTSIREWTTNHWLRGAISPKVDAGLGLGLGYTDISTRPDTRFESYRANLGWRALDKVTVSIDGGWQHWHLLSTMRQDKWYPVLNATLGWAPFEQTRIALSESRTVSSSLAGDAVTDSNTWSASLNQRLIGKLGLNLAYIHSSSDYQPSAISAFPGRSDVVSAFSSSLSIQVYQYWSVAATYQSSRNTSNQAFYQYTATQYGLSLSARF